MGREGHGWPAPGDPAGEPGEPDREHSRQGEGRQAGGVRTMTKREVILSILTGLLGGLVAYGLIALAAS